MEKVFVPKGTLVLTPKEHPYLHDWAKGILIETTKDCYVGKLSPADFKIVSCPSEPTFVGQTIFHSVQDTDTIIPNKDNDSFVALLKE